MAFDAPVYPAFVKAKVYLGLPLNLDQCRKDWTETITAADIALLVSQQRRHDRCQEKVKQAAKVIKKTGRVIWAEVQPGGPLHKEGDVIGNNYLRAQELWGEELKMAINRIMCEEQGALVYRQCVVDQC